MEYDLQLRTVGKAKFHALCAIDAVDAGGALIGNVADPPLYGGALVAGGLHKFERALRRALSVHQIVEPRGLHGGVVGTEVEVCGAVVLGVLPALDAAPDDRAGIGLAVAVAEGKILIELRQRLVGEAGQVADRLELALAAGIVGGGGFEAIIVHRKHGFAAVDVVLVADQLDGGRSVVGGKGAETEGDGKIVLHRLGLEGEGNCAGVGVQVEALDRVVELRGQRGALLHRFAHGAADARDLRGKAGLHAHDL